MGCTVPAVSSSAPVNPEDAVLFEGKWSSGCAIKGDILTWPSAVQTRVIFPSHSMIQMEHKGRSYKGVLEKGNIQWDDGDKWRKVGGHATSTTCCFAFFF